MKKVLYTTAFNCIINRYPVETMLKSAAPHVDEIVIGTICDNDDDTLDYLEEFGEKYSTTVYEFGLSKSTFAVDGKLKQATLEVAREQHGAELFIQLDADEEMRPETDGFTWADFFKQNEFALSLSSVKIPNINLYKDRAHYFSIIYKWTFHPPNANRGVVDYARLDDSKFPDWPKKFDKNRCDGCALLDKKGNLYPSVNKPSFVQNIEELKTSPFVIHSGYLNLADRAERNKNFWRATWQNYGGQSAEDMKLDEKEFDKPHKLHYLGI